jgi:ribonuclease HII
MTTALYDYDIAIAREEGEEPIIIAGVDEAGRGPLAGPVAAAAIILDLDSPIEGVNDSKKLSAARRDTLYDKIVSSGCPYGIGTASAEEIDSVNIQQATFLAMRRALEALDEYYDLLLVDGNRHITGLPRETQRVIIGGDAKSASVAAASILAKVTRDRIMDEYDKEYPQYDFAKHKGYGTKHHQAMIKKHGLSDIHRRSFCGKIMGQIGLFDG